MDGWKSFGQTPNQLSLRGEKNWKLLQLQKKTSHFLEKKKFKTFLTTSSVVKHWARQTLDCQTPGQSNFKADGAFKPKMINPFGIPNYGAFKH
jgi:hypothetical protein